MPPGSHDSLAQIDWIKAMQSKIHHHWIRPSAKTTLIKEFTCRIRVTQSLDTGVKGIETLKSCGHPALDDSLIKAINKSSPLPLPEDTSAYDPVLVIDFTPPNPG